MLKDTIEFNWKLIAEESKLRSERQKILTQAFETATKEAQDYLTSIRNEYSDKAIELSGIKGTYIALHQEGILVIQDINQLLPISKLITWEMLEKG